VSGTIARQATGAPSATTSTVIGHGTLVSYDNNLTTVIIRSPAGIYSAYDLANATSTNLSSLFIKASIAAKTITAVTVNPYNSSNVIVQTASHLFTIDLRADTITSFKTVTAGQTLESPLALSSSWLAFAQYLNASGTSQIVVYDPFSQNVVDASLSLPGHIKSLQWIRSTELGILQEDGELFRYDIPSETLTKVADDVKSFYSTSDGSAIAALESRSVEIFSLTTSDYYRFNLPEMASVQSLAWYKDGTHLFVTYPDHVSFLDLADLSLRNFTTISAIANDTVATYDVQENSLYLIDQGRKLIRFDFPN
jgi:tricorn protease-like protein